MWDLYDPFEEMRSMTKRMNNLFKPDFKGMKQPLVDIKETEKEVIVNADMPGVDKKDIDLKITEDMISIKAEKKEEAEVEKEGFYRHERSYAGFSRQFALPAKVNADKADAKFKDGVLEIKIPKVKEEKKNKIEIK